MKRGIVLGLATVFVAGSAFTAVLLWTRDDEETSGPATAIAPPALTSAVAVAETGTAEGTRPVPPGAAAALATQVAGMSGCGQPLFLTAGGLPPGTQLRVERTDLAREFVAFSSKADGTASIDAGSLLSSQCTTGAAYTLRITDDSGREELARINVEMRLLRGTIEVEPASSGCVEIVVTVRGMPSNATVTILATEPRPFASEGTFVLPRPLETNGQGMAQSAPFEPPWACDRPAVSLVAFASAGGQLRTRDAELLYRVALGAGEPVPEVERWLESMGR